MAKRKTRMNKLYTVMSTGALVLLMPKMMKVSGLVVTKIYRADFAKYLYEQMRIYIAQNEIIEGIKFFFEQFVYRYSNISCWIKFAVLLTALIITLKFVCIAAAALPDIIVKVKRVRSFRTKKERINFKDMAEALKYRLFPVKPEKKEYIGIEYEKEGKKYYSGLMTRGTVTTTENPEGYSEKGEAITIPAVFKMITTRKGVYLICIKSEGRKKVRIRYKVSISGMNRKYSVVNLN